MVMVGNSKSIDKYELQATGEAVEDAPEGMTFYSASPARGPFATLIGVSDDKVAVIGTQSPGKYRQFIQSDLGHELDVKDLYHKYGKDSDYKKSQNKFLLVVVLIVHILLIVMIKYERILC